VKIDKSTRYAYATQEEKGEINILKKKSDSKFARKCNLV
jgi:hypothetical protein